MIWCYDRYALSHSELARCHSHCSLNSGSARSHGMTHEPRARPPRAATSQAYLILVDPQTHARDMRRPRGVRTTFTKSSYIESSRVLSRLGAKVGESFCFRWQAALLAHPGRSVCVTSVASHQRKGCRAFHSRGGCHCHSLMRWARAGLTGFLVRPVVPRRS